MLEQDFRPIEVCFNVFFLSIERFFPAETLWLPVEPGIPFRLIAH